MNKKNEINLVMTCGACPEQYDALDNYRNLIGYLRLRHGVFTVQCPDCEGELVYTAYPRGSGDFCECERDYYLDEARQAIYQYYLQKDKLMVIIF